MKKKYIVVTGGAGFIGSNLIKYFLNKTKFDIISLDNYSTGRKQNEIKHKRARYIKSNTKNISKVLNLYKKNIHSQNIDKINKEYLPDFYINNLNEIYEC